MLGDGDNSFGGLDGRLMPGVLPPGYVSIAENVRMRRGYIEQRKGSWVPPWANKVIDKKIVPMGAANGGCVWQDPVGGYPWLIVAAGGKIFAGHHSRAPIEIPVPDDLVLSGRVRFVQCFDGLLAFRENEARPLIMKDLNSGFGYVDEVPLIEDEQGQAIEQHLPNGAFATKAANRIFVPHARDLVFASGVNECAKGPVTLQPFRINQGSDDSITAIVKYGKTSLVVGKERSVYVVRNVYGDLGDLVLDEFSHEYGIAGPDAVVEVGADLWFLATNRGIVSIRQTEQSELLGNIEPVSKPIQHIIDQIDWRRASRSLAHAFDSYIYFVVPVHSCGDQSWAMCVYDAAIGAWVSVDSGPWLDDPVCFMPLVYQGQQRIGILNGAGYVVLLDDGYNDQYMDGSILSKRAVAGRVKTRGYHGAMPGHKIYKRLDWLIETRDPHYDVTGDPGGVTETCMVRKDITKRRNVFGRPWNAPRFNPLNKDDNQWAPNREDYSFDLSQGPMCVGDNGIKAGLMQEFNESASLSRSGPYFQVEFRFHRGTFKLKQVTCGAQPSSAGQSTKI